ncbi:MAG: exodeoxyribonuclease V subunit gamma, partial [Actinomycetota bacterium]|nr:exodeoxyribonuclease V subunit gamma [Actinomycetota bacterium]
VDDLSALASGRAEELPARFGEYAHPAIAHLERRLFANSLDSPATSVPADGAPPLEGAIRFLEGAGARGTLELVGDELLRLIRDGTPPERIALICPALERWRVPVETTLATLGVPFALEGRARLSQTPFGQALTAVLRFEWLAGGRRDLYAFLRSPYSGVPRPNVDFLEGRLRGRAVDEHDRVEEETLRLRGHPIPILDCVRGASSSLTAVRTLATTMLRSAYGTDSPPVAEAAQQDLRSYETVLRVVDELEEWRRRGGSISAEELVAALERSTLPPARAADPGRVAVLDLLRARTRPFDVVFVLGLEDGSLPRRGHSSPFLDDAARRELDGRTRARLTKVDPVARDRYLFYTACTRATGRLYLVREAATEDGSPREPSPFWEEARTLFEPDDVARWTRRRALSALTWPLEQAPTERERLRALATLAATDGDGASALAASNGWERRLERARRAFSRPTRLTHPLVLEELAGRTLFNVTELERFADCSSAWFVERLIDPRTIDAEVDAKLRGSLAHAALFKFFSRVPKQLGVERIGPEHVEDALAFLRRCLEEALAGVRMELRDLERQELDQGLWRDLEQFIRAEADSDVGLVPRRFEVSFGSERSAPELQRGLDVGGVTVSGKIDRIDVDPFSARGIVQDYKSGKSGHSAAQIESESRLQIPLYMLVLRDLVGIEPLGGLYRPLAGERRARGLLRAEARDDGLDGFVRTDYLDEEAFWRQVENARTAARSLAGRIRAGDVRHDPRGGDCPAWCDLWRMCRVSRA